MIMNWNFFCIIIFPYHPLYFPKKNQITLQRRRISPFLQAVSPDQCWHNLYSRLLEEGASASRQPSGDRGFWSSMNWHSVTASSGNMLFLPLRSLGLYLTDWIAFTKIFPSVRLDLLLPNGEESATAWRKQINWTPQAKRRIYPWENLQKERITRIYMRNYTIS